MALQIQVKRPPSYSLKIAGGIIGVFLCIALGTRFFEGADGKLGQNPQTSWQVYFSPGGGCTGAIVQELAEAKESVFVQAYSFTSEPIAKAIVDAKNRGISTSVILDKSQSTEKYSEADFLNHAKIRLLIDDQHAINHNKVMIIDGATVVTGSFNFTSAAENKNAENLLIIHDKDLAQRYTENWYVHAAHSKAYVGR